MDSGLAARNSRLEKKGAIARAQCKEDNTFEGESEKRSYRKIRALAPVSYRPPNPADCIDCREISDVDAMPCMRSLKSSAFEAFSRAVS